MSLKGVRLVEAAVLNSEGADTTAPDVSTFNYRASSLAALAGSTESLDSLLTRLLFLFQGFPFQLGYCETNELNNCSPQYILYLVAASEKERLDWIKVLRKSKWCSLFAASAVCLIRALLFLQSARRIRNRFATIRDCGQGGAGRAVRVSARLVLAVS